AAADATSHSSNVDRSGQEVARLAERLKTRCVIFLRLTEIGDRRRHERLPSELAVKLDNGLSGCTADISEGGVLVRLQDSRARQPEVRAVCNAEIAGIGSCRLRLVNQSPLGLHLCFEHLEDAPRAALERKLAQIRADNTEFIERAIEAADKVAHAFEDA